MSFLDALTLVPDDFLTKENSIELFKKSLGFLNILQLYRLKADAFAHNGLTDDYYKFEKFSEFESKYLSLCLFIVNDLYQNKSININVKTEMVLSYSYSLLAKFIEVIDYMDDEIKELLKENDKYKEEK